MFRAVLDFGASFGRMLQKGFHLNRATSLATRATVTHLPTSKTRHFSKLVAGDTKLIVNPPRLVQQQLNPLTKLPILANKPSVHTASTLTRLLSQPIQMDQVNTKRKLPELISKTTFKPKESNDSYCSVFYHSNDDGLAKALRQYGQRTTPIIPAGKKPIAFSVGDAHFLSLTSLQPVYGTLHADTSPEAIDSINLRRKALVDSNNEVELNEKLQEAPKKYELLNDTRRYNSLTSLGQDHFAASTENFAAAKASLQKPFSAVAIDLFNTEQVKRLAQELRDNNLVISILNITNLWEYEPEQNLLIENLKLLPLAENVHFIFSAKNLMINKFFHHKAEPLISIAAKTFLEMDTFLFKLRLVDNYLYMEEETAFKLLAGNLDWKTYANKQGHSLLYRMIDKLDFQSFSYAVKSGAQFLESDFNLSGEIEPQKRLDDLIKHVERRISDQGNYEHYIQRGNEILKILREKGQELIPQKPHPELVRRLACR